MRDQFAVQISKSALHDFVKVRSRRAGKISVQPAIPPSSPSLLPSRNVSDSCETTPIRQPRASDPQADLYVRIEELKRRKRTPVLEPKFKFHYEEGEPLRLISDPNKDK